MGSFVGSSFGIIALAFAVLDLTGSKASRSRCRLSRCFSWA
jgi:hypothetical protein